MPGATFSEALLTLNYADLIEIVHKDERLKEIDFINNTIEQIGNRFLPEVIDGDDISYASWPRYWMHFKNEFKKLLCTSDKKYQSLRKELSATANKSHATLVSSIAAVMASEFGVVAGVLVPFCSLILIAVLKLGIEAFCACTSIDILIEEKL